MEPKSIANAATLAAILEASVEKPGAVTPTKGFKDLRYADFLDAALSMRPAIERVAKRGALAACGKTEICDIGIGKAVYEGFRPKGTNINFGIILMFMPLAAAAGYDQGNLRKSLGAVLKRTTPRDSIWIYKAMRKCNLGGMKIRDKQLVDLDVYSNSALAKIRCEALNPLEIFKRCSGIDNLAKEWVTEYRLCFKYAKRLTLNEGSILRAYIDLLANNPDTFIARKAGFKEAERVSGMARLVIAGKMTIGELDKHLRSKGNSLNPGTTCDLIATALFIKLLE